LKGDGVGISINNNVSTGNCDGISIGHYVCDWAITTSASGNQADMHGGSRQG
jgi:hypothetical protein